jgi:hypothetical protein
MTQELAAELIESLGDDPAFEANPVLTLAQALLNSTGDSNE